MGEKEVQQLREIASQMRGEIPNALNPLAEFEKMANYLRHIEEGIISLNQVIQVLGFEADYCRRTIQMTHRILIDKGIISLEEIQEKHMKEVAEPIEKTKKEIEEKIKEAVAMQNNDKNAIFNKMEDQEEINVRKED